MRRRAAKCLTVGLVYIVRTSARNYCVVAIWPGILEFVYDVPSSYPYGDVTMAMSIGGRSGGDFGVADFVQLGTRLSVPERAVRRVLADLNDRAEAWLAELDTLPFGAGKIKKLRRVIAHRRKRIAV